MFLNPVHENPENTIVMITEIRNKNGKTSKPLKAVTVSLTSKISEFNFTAVITNIIVYKITILSEYLLIIGRFIIK